MPRVCLYSPANMNIVSGSSIWVQSTVEVLHVGPGVEIVVPLRTPERRRLTTDLLRRLDRVELVDPRRQRRWLAPSGLDLTDALDLIERLDAERPFDAILLRSFSLCLAAIERPRLRDRLWSLYVLEPERDVEDPDHRRDLARIAAASRYVVVQSEEMRALFEAAVPTGRGKTILLPPAVPPPGEQGVPVGIAPPARRLWYAGKYDPFYPVPRMIDITEALRPEYPDLEFHALGDQVSRRPADRAWADELTHRLTSTAGVVWHGAMARDDVVRLLATGGIGLSLWDYRHGSTMNDLVVSTKLLDYCLAGIPVVLNRTAAQETILGRDYPLFVRSADEAEPRIRSLLADPALYREAAIRTKAAATEYAYTEAYAGVGPYLEDRPERWRHLARRPKLDGSEARVGIPLASGASAVPEAVIGAIRAARQVRPDAAFVLAVPGTEEPPPGRDPAAALRAALPDDIGPAVAMRTVTDPDNWWRTIGIALALEASPDATQAGPSLLDHGIASGARVVRDAAELVAALSVIPATPTSTPQ